MKPRAIALSRTIALSLTLLVIAAAFYMFRSNAGRTQPEAKESRRLMGEEFKAAHRAEIAEDYHAREHNGSQRSALTVEQLPAQYRTEAARLVRQYQTEIYPLLKKYVAEHDGLLPEPGTVPEFDRFIDSQAPNEEAIRKFPRRGMFGWSIGMNPRMDGTVVARDVYSQNPPDAPHDVWAENTRFLMTPDLKRGFIISGWDDGKVTIDFNSQLYYGRKKTRSGMSAGHAASGEAGIPPASPRGLDAWLETRRARLKPGAK